MINLGLSPNQDVLPSNSLVLVLDSNLTKPLLKYSLEVKPHLFFPFSSKNLVPLANTITGLHPMYLVFQPEVLVKFYQLSLEDSLLRWGDKLWPLLKSWDGIFFFIAKNNVQDLRELFWLWQKKHTHVCFKDKYDLSKLVIWYIFKMRLQKLCFYLFVLQSLNKR